MWNKNEKWKRLCRNWLQTSEKKQPNFRINIWKNVCFDPLCPSDNINNSNTYIQFSLLFQTPAVPQTSAQKINFIPGQKMTFCGLYSNFWPIPRTVMKTWDYREMTVRSFPSSLTDGLSSAPLILSLFLDFGRHDCRKNHSFTWPKVCGHPRADMNSTGLLIVSLRRFLTHHNQNSQLLTQQKSKPFQSVVNCR